jgi:predicted Ser/Thr protein kinase
MRQGTPVASTEDRSGLLRRAREGMHLLPSALHDPRLVWRWLAGARGAQIAALVLVPGLWFGLPAVLAPALDALYPPVVEREKILGLFPYSVSRDDPLRERRELQLEALAWLAALSGIGILLLARLPETGPEDPGASVRRLRSPSVHEHDDPARLMPVQPALLDPASPGGRYRLKEELARGGMGVVYRAVDEVLGREVALKELPHSLADRGDFAHRFRQEARVLARLSHPNVVGVFDLVEDAGRLWIAMELVDGGDLANLLKSRGRLPVAEALRLALGIAQGIRHAHAQGVIHRDIKAMNVLLTLEGLPKVTDFGLARFAESSVHTREGTVLGSPRYMSPEQAAGRPADARSDIYSFGILLYEMLAGRAPFEGDARSVIAQQISHPPASLREFVPDVPGEVERAIMAMLAKDPDARPRDFTSVAKGLRDLALAARARERRCS